MAIPAPIAPTDTFKDWREKTNELIDTFVDVTTSTSDPTPDDGSNAGFRVGSTWIQESTEQVFTCMDATPGSAEWLTQDLPTQAGNASFYLQTDGVEASWEPLPVTDEFGLTEADIGVTVEAFDADTSKTDVAETRTANIDLLTYTEKYISIGTNGIIDLSLGTVFTHTHGGAMSEFTISNVPTTGSSGFILILVNGGSYPLTWWTGAVWPAATPPTLTAVGTDIFTFTTNDNGTTWFGIASGIGMA